MSENHFQSRWREAVQVLIVVVMIAAAWLLLSGGIKSEEIIAAVAAGLITAIAGYLLRVRTGHRQKAFKLWITHLPGIILSALKDSWIVSAALFRSIAGKPTQGTFKRYKFTAQSDNPEDTGRRILATIGTTLQPNTYVVGYNREENEILVHELVPGSGVPISDDIRGAE